MRDRVAMATAAGHGEEDGERGNVRASRSVRMYRVVPQPPPPPPPPLYLMKVVKKRN